MTWKREDELRRDETAAIRGWIIITSIELFQYQCVLSLKLFIVKISWLSKSSAPSSAGRIFSIVCEFLENTPCFVFLHRYFPTVSYYSWRPKSSLIINDRYTICCLVSFVWGSLKSFRLYPLLPDPPEEEILVQCEEFLRSSVGVNQLMILNNVWECNHCLR